MRDRGSRARRSATVVVVVAALLSSCATQGPERQNVSRGVADATTPAPVGKSLGAPAVVDQEEAFIDEVLDGWTLEQTLASLIMVAAPGTDPQPARRLIDAHALGGFIVMGSNVSDSVDQVSGFVAALSGDPLVPVLVAVDQEGGDVRRLPGDAFAAGRGAHTADPAAVELAFRERAEIVESAGIAVNFGIVADVTSDPQSFIFRRVLGTDPAAAADRVAAAVRGENGRVLSTLKHFPGHGASPADSHVSIPVSDLDESTWLSTHGAPFRAGIEAGAPLVMTGHLLFPAISTAPASLSEHWISVLRSDWGFEGVIVTDDLLMLQRSGNEEFADPHENAVRALAAGNDMVLFVLPADPASVGVDVAALIDRLALAVTSGEIARDSVEQSARRVLTLRRSTSDERAPSCGPRCEGVPLRAGWRAP